MDTYEIGLTPDQEREQSQIAQKINFMKMGMRGVVIEKLCLENLKLLLEVNLLRSTLGMEPKPGYKQD